MATPADLAVGLVTSVIYDAVKRPLRDLQTTAGRRTEIKKALVGQPSGEMEQIAQAAAASLADLARVLGNDYGTYSKRVERFLSELKRSAIPHALLKLTIKGQKTDELFQAFNFIHAASVPLPFEARPLFDALCSAINARINSAVQDPVLLEIIRSQSSDIRDELTQLRLALQRLTTSAATVDIDTFIAARTRIAKWIEGENRDLPIETDRGTKRVLITKIVIPARLKETDNKKPDTPSMRGQRDTTIGIVDFRRNFHRAIVLGDPGGGKSTLTQLLCYDLSRKIIAEAQNPGAKHYHSGDLRIPLRVVVRSLDRRQKHDAGYSILDHLVDEIRPVLDNDANLTEGVLRQALSLGQAVLLFDGLDELLDVERRRQMARAVEQFCSSYPACPALVTSRVVGYRDAPLSSDFEAFSLSRLNQDEIHSYCQRLVKAIGGPKQAVARELADRFIEQTRRTASDLRENPLLLGLMVYIFMEKGDVPDNRPEIYRECSQLMFLRWDQRRDIRFEYPDDFELMDLFGHLAVQIFGDSDAEEGVSEQWLNKKIREFFEDWYSDRPRAVAASTALVKFITGRAWVMCDVGPGTYKFTHRTFMEYFVARRLDSESESISELLTTLYPRIVLAEWDVVSHLALQIASSSGPKALRSVEALHDLLERPDRTPTEEINLLFFAARALEYLPVPESRYKNIAQEIAERATVIGSTLDVTSFGIFVTLLSKSKKKRPLAESLVSEHVNREMTSRNPMRRRFGRFLLGASEVTYWRPSGTERVRVWEEDADALHGCLSKLREQYREILYDEAVKDSFAARMYCYIYRDRTERLYEIHGQNLLFVNEDRSTPPEFTLWHARRLSLTNAAVLAGVKFGQEWIFSRELIEKLASDIAGERPFRDAHLERSFDAHRDISDLIVEHQRYFLQGAHRIGRSRSAEKRRCELSSLIIICSAFVEMEMELNMPGLDKKKRRKESRSSSPYVSNFRKIIGEALRIHPELPRASLIRQWLSGDLNFIEYIDATISN